MKNRYITSILFSLWAFSPIVALEVPTTSADEALKRIMEGNTRYVKDKLIHPDRTSDRREAVSSKQYPIATIVGCSDSRVAPEIIFDQGIGDIFVVRVAGNVVGEIELNSIDYAADILHAPLIIVLGHENCGAVSAVIEGKATDDIAAIAHLIQPAFEIAKQEEGNLLENTVKENVRLVVRYLEQTPILKSLIEKGQVKIVGAYYHLNTGEVKILK